MINAFQTHIKYITNFKPCFNTIDNVASKVIKVYLQEDNIQIQLVEPHHYRVNTTERVIHNFKE